LIFQTLYIQLMSMLSITGRC